MLPSDLSTMPGQHCLDLNNLLENLPQMINDMKLILLIVNACIWIWRVGILEL